MASTLFPQHPSQVSLKNCCITKPNGLLATKVALNPSMIVNFDLRENLYSPFMGGTITISDSVNFINSYPKTGGEIIEFEVETSYQKEPVTDSYTHLTLPTSDLV